MMLICSLDNILTFWIFPQQLSKIVTSVHFTRFLRQLYELKWDLDQKEKTMTIFSSLPDLHSHIVLWNFFAQMLKIKLKKEYLVEYYFYFFYGKITNFLIYLYIFGHISTWVLEGGCSFLVSDFYTFWTGFLAYILYDCFKKIENCCFIE